MERLTEEQIITRLSERIQQSVFDTNIIEYLIRTSTHGDIYHTNLSYGKISNQIQRMLTDNKTAESIFYNIDHTLENAILDKSMTIARWLRSPSKEPLKLNVKTDDETPVGIGIRYTNDKLQECEAYNTTVILKKLNNDYGFSCITAYPNILCKSAKPTNKDITTNLHETHYYQTADAREQGKLDRAVQHGLKQKNHKIPEHVLEIANAYDQIHNNTCTNNYEKT